MTAQEQIAIFIDEALEGTDCFLVDFKIKPTNNYKIYIDSDTQFTLEKCMRINRNLRKKVEEAELYPDGDVSLEVSSPGVDSPLKLFRQYKKNIGRTLEIILTDEAAMGITGKLITVEEDTIQIEKKQIKSRSKKIIPEVEILDIPLSSIKSATVCIEF